MVDYKQSNMGGPGCDTFEGTWCALHGGELPGEECNERKIKKLELDKMWECDDCKMNQEDRLLANQRSMELEAEVEELEDLLEETKEELIYVESGRDRHSDPTLFTRIHRVLSKGSAS